MNILTLAGVVLTASVLSLFLKQQRSDFSFLVALAAGCAVLFSLLAAIGEILDFSQTLGALSGIDNGNLQILFRVLGIAYVGQFASDLCRDAGESGLAGSVELAGRVLMVLLSLPLVSQLLEFVEQVLE